MVVTFRSKDGKDFKVPWEALQGLSPFRLGGWALEHSAAEVQAYIDSCTGADLTVRLTEPPAQIGVA